MKMFAAAATVVALAVSQVLAQPGAPSPPYSGKAGPVCLYPRMIDHTHVVDSRTILFYMRDGKVWRNTMKARCPGLMFHGFVYVTRFDELCSNMQGIRVIKTGEVCVLGTFTPERAPRPHI